MNKEIDDCCEGKVKCMDAVSLEIIEAARKPAEAAPIEDRGRRLLVSHWKAPLLLTPAREPRVLTASNTAL